jgi:hypothetical protein
LLSRHTGSLSCAIEGWKLNNRLHRTDIRETRTIVKLSTRDILGTPQG